MTRFSLPARMVHSLTTGLVLTALLLGCFTSVPGCSKKDNTPAPGGSGNPDTMEGGSGATPPPPDAGEPVVGSPRDAPSLAPEEYATVTGGADFPDDATDDPLTPEDERVDALPYHDERQVAKRFEALREFQRDAALTPSPDMLPESLGGLVHDAEFYGGNGDDPDAPIIEHTDKGRKVRVWFGTNRALVDPSDPRQGFSNERETDPAKLHVGSVVCDVPNSRPVGTTGSSFVTRLIKGEDDRIKIEKLFVEDEDLMFRQIARRLALAPGNQRCVVVYIHGYKNSFESAALRAAQLAVDLNVPGLTAFYSWPSKDAVSEYNADEAAVETAEKHLQRFLVRFARDTNASRVHIIAHSMGNRVLARVMQRIASAPDTKDLKFGQIILAAPDIDTQVFFDLAAHYPKLSDRTTLYVSQKDKALEASAWTHSYPRAGYAPPVAVLPPIDTIEVTNIDVSILGHGYVAEAEHVLFDMAMMIRADTPPARRPRLHSSTTPEGAAFWILDEPAR